MRTESVGAAHIRLTIHGREVEVGQWERMHLAIARLAAARTERDQLRMVRKWLTACERERAWPNTTDADQDHPCWKWINVADHGAEDSGSYAGGAFVEGWCDPCRLRNGAHIAYKAAVMAYGRAATSFWLTVRGMQSRGAL